MTFLDQTRNVIALLTPPGKAGIATLGLQGQGTWSALASLFRRPRNKALPALEAGQLFFGRLGESDSLADEVVLAVTHLRAEIHCHGGREVVNLILELFQAKGFQVVSWQDLEDQAGNQRTHLEDLLVQAPTLRTANILLDQVMGATDRFLARLAALSAQKMEKEAAQARQRFIRWESLGAHLVQPWKVVVAGAPNVGKSSLVNAIAGYERSIVSPIPGTTRDVVSATLAIDGWPVELLDTAGLREHGDLLEEAGMNRAQEAAAQANLVLWVMDATQSPDPAPKMAALVIPVINKVDLPPAWELKIRTGALRVSAKTGAGLDELRKKISLTLVPEVPEPGEAIPAAR